jgi:hypothetical protein
MNRIEGRRKRFINKANAANDLAAVQHTASSQAHSMR